MESPVLPPAVRMDLSEVFHPNEGEGEEMGKAWWPKRVHLLAQVGHIGNPQSGEGDRVIFYKHYVTSFVGDKMFAKLCWKNGTSA